MRFFGGLNSEYVNIYIDFSNLRNFLQGLIFVVDSNDRERIQEAAEELQKMVSISAF